MASAEAAARAAADSDGGGGSSEGDGSSDDGGGGGLGGLGSLSGAPTPVTAMHAAKRGHGGADELRKLQARLD